MKCDGLKRKLNRGLKCALPLTDSAGMILPAMRRFLLLETETLASAETQKKKMALVTKALISTDFTTRSRFSMARRLMDMPKIMRPF